LLLNEGISLEPDVVTLYSGINDAAASIEEVAEPLVGQKNLYPYKFIRKYRNAMISIALLDNIFQQKFENFAYKNNSMHVDAIRSRYISNVRKMHELTIGSGAFFLPATQQAKSNLLDSDELRGVTYKNEVKLLSDKVGANQPLSLGGIYLLVHNELMGELRRLFDDDFNIPVVDVINAMDHRRDYLLSWVHVSPDGNKVIAREFANAILPIACD
jgi:hypothetical protein